MTSEDQPSRPRDPSDDDHAFRVPERDDDPTGVQRLLSSLPDPGPMPPDLVERITASLREEAERRDRDPDVVHAPFGSTAPRLRRTPWLRVAAAAAVVVAGAGGVAVAGGLPGADNLAGLARFPGLSPASQTGASTSGAEQAQMPGQPGTSATDVARGSASFMMSGIAYTAPTLRTKAAELMRAGHETLTTPQAESPWIGPIATPVGLGSCLHALGLPQDAKAVVDLAEYDARPAVVIVTHAGDHDQVHVVRRECSEDDPHLVAGPYALS